MVRCMDCNREVPDWKPVPRGWKEVQGLDGFVEGDLCPKCVKKRRS